MDSGRKYRARRQLKILSATVCMSLICVKHWQYYLVHMFFIVLFERRWVIEIPYFLQNHNYRLSKECTFQIAFSKSLIDSYFGLSPELELTTSYDWIKPLRLMNILFIFLSLHSLYAIAHVVKFLKMYFLHLFQLKLKVSTIWIF